MKTTLAIGAVLLAFLGVFLFAEGRRLRLEYADAVRRSRWQKAATLADDLAWVGQPIPDTDRATLDGQIVSLQRQTGRVAHTTHEQYQQAIALSQLDRFAEAERLLRPLLDRESGAKVMLATVLQAQGRYAESGELFLQCRDEAKIWRTLPSLMPRYLAAAGGTLLGWSARNEMAERRNRADADLQRCVDGLAYNARQQKQHSLATTIYRQAIAEQPSSAAYYQFQLGLTCVEAEHFREAIAAFQEAERLEPHRWGSAVQEQVRRIRTKSRGCQF